MKAARRDFEGVAVAAGSDDVKGGDGWGIAGGEGSVVQPVSMASMLVATQPLMMPWRTKTGPAIKPASGGE